LYATGKNSSRNVGSTKKMNRTRRNSKKQTNVQTFYPISFIKSFNLSNFDTSQNGSMNNSILHIYNNLELHADLEGVFEDFDYKFAGCENFKNVKNLIEANKPGLILISIETPDKGMMDFFRDYKSLRESGVLVLALISTENAAAKSILKFGFNDYIAKENDSATIAKTAMQFLKRNATSDDLKDVSVCIIDDDAFHTKLLELIFRKKGIKNIIMYNSAEAFIESPKDAEVFIVDVFMKKISGIKLVEKIRKMYPTKLIFVVSSVTEESVATTAFRYGADDFMFKPVNPEILTAKIRSRYGK